MIHLYLVTDPGQDEDKQDKEDLDDPEYARQGAEEMAASSNTPGQEPENELVIVRGLSEGIKLIMSGSPGGGDAPGGCLGHADIVARFGHRLGWHPAAHREAINLHRYIL